MRGIFGSLFDFNRDGELNAFEMGAELSFLDELSWDDAWGENSEGDWSDMDFGGYDGNF